MTEQTYRDLSKVSAIEFEQSVASTLTEDEYIAWFRDELLIHQPDRDILIDHIKRYLDGTETNPYRASEQGAVNFSLLHDYQDDGTADLRLIALHHRLHGDFFYPDTIRTINASRFILEQGNVEQMRQTMLASGLLQRRNTNRNERQVIRQMLPMNISALVHSVPFDWAIQVDAHAGSIRRAPAMRRFYDAGMTPAEVTDLATCIASHLIGRGERLHDDQLRRGMLRASHVVPHTTQHAALLAVSGVRWQQLDKVSAEAAALPPEYAALLWPPVPPEEWDT